LSPRVRPSGEVRYFVRRRHRRPSCLYTHVRVCTERLPRQSDLNGTFIQVISLACSRGGFYRRVSVANNGDVTRTIRHSTIARISSVFHPYRRRGRSNDSDYVISDCTQRVEPLTRFENIDRETFSKLFTIAWWLDRCNFSTNTVTAVKDGWK